MPHVPPCSDETYRASDGEAAAQVEVSSFHPTDIQLARTGNTFTFSSAVFGENYKSVSHGVALEQAVFSNVRVIIPAAPNFKPYTDYLGSHLEVMDVAIGLRRILHSEPGSIQAPHWTRDDRLIYNSVAGVMYTYEIPGRIRSTGSATSVSCRPRAARRGRSATFTAARGR